MSKGPEAFRTISEVAEELDLPQHVLRFWETRFTHIRPMKRGGGRRYYRPDDVDLLRGIRTLLYGEGYTIRGVQRILKEHGPRFVIGAGRGEFAGLARGGDTGEDDVADSLPVPPVRTVRREPILERWEDDGTDDAIAAEAGEGEPDDEDEADDTLEDEAEDEFTDDAAGEDELSADKDEADAEDGEVDEADEEEGEEDESGEDEEDTDDEGGEGAEDDVPADDDPDEEAGEEEPRVTRPSRSGPQAYRPPERAPSIYAKPGSARLGADDIRRLQAVLGDLLELKRLLDQARG